MILLRAISLGLLITAPTITLGNALNATEETVNKDQELHSIELKLVEIENELAKYRLNSLNDEVKSQTDMIDHWHQFADHLKQSENAEKHIHHLKAQKKVLLEQKAALLSK